MYFSQKSILLFALFEAVIGSNVIRLPLERVTLQNNDHLKNRKRDDTLLSSILGGDDHHDSNKVALLNDVEIHQYGIKIQVGTPSTEFLLLFDTGSSDTWVPSIKCQRENGCVSNQKYNASASSTFTARPEKVNITYAIGYASGDYFQDQLKLNDDQLVIKDQVLVRIDENKGPIATQGHPSKDKTIIDGVFGAGFPAGTLMAMENNHNDNDVKDKKKNKKGNDTKKKSNTYTPFIMNLWNQSLIKEPLFSLSMDPDSANDKSSEWLGEIVLGGIDDTKYKEPIQYTPVVPRQHGDHYSHWLVNVAGFRYEGNHSDFTNYRFVEPTRFIVDSGSNFMYLPTELSDALAKKITQKKKLEPNSTFYFVDCNLMNDHRPATIHTMFPTEKNATASFPMTIPVSKLIGKSGDDQCFLLFMPAPPGTAFTLGNFWLRHFVSVFDFGKHRIGFSKYSTSLSSSSIL